MGEIDKRERSNGKYLLLVSKEDWIADECKGREERQASKKNRHSLFQHSKE